MEVRILAQQDADNAAKHGVDLNPFSTHGTRHLWQLGFDGQPNPALNDVGGYNWRAWERGRIARELLNARTSAPATASYPCGSLGEPVESEGGEL